MSSAEPDPVLGLPGYVTLQIPGGSEPGEVLLRLQGGSESYIAYCDQPVEEGAQVVVVAHRGARMLTVSPL